MSIVGSVAELVHDVMPRQSTPQLIQPEKTEWVQIFTVDKGSNGIYNNSWFLDFSRLPFEATARDSDWSGQRVSALDSGGKINFPMTF